ncbi:MAG: MurR/RpiR family transcriptional regulator [Acidimicrobiia bacterium]|nr:MurR/RpiR family transcriptional regulator [Acidimicrobiia bacterium]
MDESRTVSALVAEAAVHLTPAERRVAEAVIDDPKLVAFGTVAQLAARSSTSGPTVLRFAGRLGFVGFVDLQAFVREQIADQLRPATERIRERPATDVVARTLTTDLDNVRTTLEGVDEAAFAATVGVLADRQRSVYVLAGEDSRGVGVVLATQLDLLRDRVTLIEGSSVRVSRQIAEIAPGDVVVAVDHRRYERWLLEAARRAVSAGAVLVAVSDSALSPLAEAAARVFVAGVRGVGPFDSHAGAFALVHALVAGVAAKLRRRAVGRLDAVEAAWRDGGDLVDHSPPKDERR